MARRSFTMSCCGAALGTLVMLTAVCAAPVETDPQAMMYLSQFGYLSPKLRKPGSESIMTEETLKKAVAEFQSFAGINATGVLDNETKTLMSLPRCGVKDIIGTGSNARKRRYALQGSRWRVKSLTYRISSYPKGLNTDEVDKEIARSFEVWSDYTDLTFTARKSGQVHIDIRFARGEHGDGDPFDGPGGTLAHAYFPVYGGDAHFDDAESWTIRSYRGTNLFQVAAHEFGHSLGLSHSDIRAALMAPFYRGYDSSFKLNDDDIQAIQNLYGKRDTSKITPTKPSESSDTGGARDDAELCATGAKIDALFTESGNTYAFKGDKYWLLSDEGIASGYPKLISSAWSGLPSNIDAAFTYGKNGKTYFFKGNQYWRYSGKKIDPDYPKRITDGFQGIPSNVDAAMVWGGNGKIYFFKGSLFWRFDPTSKPPVKGTYPKNISNWLGVPNDIDSALQYTNGYTYFFKGGQYYRFNDRTFAVDTADPTFPRPSGFWWFGCQGGNVKGSRGGSQRQPPQHPLDRPASRPDEGDLTLDTDEHQMMYDQPISEQEHTQHQTPLAQEPPLPAQSTSHGVPQKTSSTSAMLVCACAVLLAHLWS